MGFDSFELRFENWSGLSEKGEGREGREITMFFHDAYVVRKEEIITATGEIGFSFIVAFPFLRAFPILSFNIFETLKELLSMNMSTRA